jgi:succinate dehydrogenase/fumarate reductase flavoprotein subunit
MSEFSPNRPCALTQVSQFDQETDVIVVGFGAAGACAAIEAARSGARVTLLEATGGSGGTSSLSGGEIYLGGNGGTPIQRAAGFTDETADLFRYLVMASGENVDEAKARAYAQGSLSHFHWLCAQGVQYKNSYIPGKIVEPATDDCLIWSGSEAAWPFVNEARPCPRGHCPQFSGLGGGKHLMDALASRVRELDIEVRYNTRAHALIRDDVGRVHGLIARTAEGRSYVRARKGVVLCAGGFIMNRDMVRRHAPLLLRSRHPLGTLDDGSGIQLGLSVGAAAINMSEGFVTLPWYPPGSLVKGIFINGRGQRFVNEDCYHGRVSQFILQQPGDRIWLLADQVTYGAPEFQQLARIEIGAAGETWEEVERELRLPDGALVDTVALYNRYAARGEDPLFHKAPQWLQPLDNPPFVALDCRVDHCFYSSFTLGGLDTAPTGEVLNEDREPIAGLYAAGRTACGLPRWGPGYSSGMSLADATFFGRQAGLTAARSSLA